MQLPNDVQPISKVDWGDAEDSALFKSMMGEAQTFLSGFRWCREISDLYLGRAVPGIVAVFLARIVPAEGADEWLWLVVGDLPPAYLVVDNAPDSNEALRAYIREMDRWVAAARAGRSTDDLIPVNVAPTPEAADALHSRLRFLAAEVIDPLG